LREQSRSWSWCSSCASWSTSSPSDDAPSLNELDLDDDDGDDEKDLDEARQGVARHKAEQLEHQQNYENRPQHLRLREITIPNGSGAFAGSFLLGDMLVFVLIGKCVRFPMVDRAVLVLGWRVDGEQPQVL
jgi:hypothetical protein